MSKHSSVIGWACSTCIASTPTAKRWNKIAKLPDEALAFYAEILSTLELVPWNGESYNRAKPDSSMRQWTFGQHGEGLVVYLILEDQQRVDVLRVLWLDQRREPVTH